MKNKKLKNIILVLIILLFTLLSYILIMILSLRTQKNTSENLVFTQDVSSKNETLANILKQHDVILINNRESTNEISVTFPKDLYDENGRSNEDFLNSLIEDLNKFIKKKEYYLVDEEKNIEIRIIMYEKEDRGYKVLINGIEDFYTKTRGEDYIGVEKSKLSDSTNFFQNNSLLFNLSIRNMFLSSIEKQLGEGTELDDGYISYLNGTVKLRTVPTKAVRNIIFTDGYEENITSKVNMDTSLEEILEYYPKNSFGSLDKEYLGYITENFYYFFYKDEISIYGYSYDENKKFEEILSEYLETKDLDSFVEKLSAGLKVYDFFEYDKDEKKAHIIYSSRGIEINIEDNDPKGITLYSNYYFTGKTKKFVKNGLINFSSEDLVEKIEIERRSNK